MATGPLHGVPFFWWCLIDCIWSGGFLWSPKACPNAHAGLGYWTLPSTWVLCVQVSPPWCEQGPSSPELTGSENCVTLFPRGTGALTFPVGFQFQDWNERGKLVKKAHFPSRKYEWWWDEREEGQKEEARAEKRRTKERKGCIPLCVCCDSVYVKLIFCVWHIHQGIRKK